MHKVMALMVPTRGRPQQAQEHYNNVMDMSGSALTDVFYLVDSNDPCVDEYLDQLGWHVKVTPGTGSVNALNWNAGHIMNRYDHIAYMGDDHFPRTKNWDEKYANELYALGHGFVYGNDLLMGERIPTQIAMTSSIAQAMRYFGPPGFTHLCVDLAWKDIGEGLDKISYMPDVIIEHMHPANGKSKEDEGYRRVNSSEMVARDSAYYYEWKEHELPLILDDLIYELGLPGPTERATL